MTTHSGRALRSGHRSCGMRARRRIRRRQRGRPVRTRIPRFRRSTVRSSMWRQLTIRLETWRPDALQSNLDVRGWRFPRLTRPGRVRRVARERYPIVPVAAASIARSRYPGFTGKADPNSTYSAASTRSGNSISSAESSQPCGVASATGIASRRRSMTGV